MFAPTRAGEAIAMAERLFTVPMTSDFDRLEHEIADEVVQANLRTDGLFGAVCGATVRVVSLLHAPGRPCKRCQRIVAAARRAAATPPPVEIPEQSRGRHQRRRRALSGGRR
jgi:hypothetical protein